MQDSLFQGQWGIWFSYPTETKGEAKQYGDKLDLICTISSVQDLAYLWNKSPIGSLSNYFIREDSTCAAYKIDNQWRKVNAINFFRSGIEPKWQDPKNKQGGYFRFQIQNNQANHQQIYSQLIFYFLGSDFDLADKVNGLRFISSKNNVNRYRIQVWVNINNKDTNSLEKFQTLFAQLFTTFKLNNKNIQFKNIKVQGEEK